MAAMRSRRRRRAWPVLLGSAAALLAALAAAWWLMFGQTAEAAVVRRDAPLSSADDTSESAAGAGEVLQNGVRYRYNQNLDTVLFLGIDDNDVAAETNTALMGGNGFSDMMLLMILDNEHQTVRMLQISRDCMMDIDVYDAFGRSLGVVHQQLCYQYSYGTGRANGNWLAKNKVSELLYGVPVQAALSLKMEAVAPMVDLLGGLNITVPQDYTAIDPAFAAGAQLTMTGAQAYRYVRYRDIEELGSNNDRMARQTQVLLALVQKLQSGGSALAEQLQNFAQPYMESDLDAETIQKLTRYAPDTELRKVPGQTEAGTHDEYIVDEAALRAMVIELFYQPVA